MSVAQLVPVKDWVYDLFAVKYWDREGGKVLVGPVYICSSYEGHLKFDIDERWPSMGCTWCTWDPVAENVGPPRKVGSYYGMPLTESAWEHGRREAEKRGL